MYTIIKLFLIYCELRYIDAQLMSKNVKKCFLFLIVPSISDNNLLNELIVRYIVEYLHLKSNAVIPPLMQFNASILNTFRGPCCYLVYRLNALWNNQINLYLCKRQQKYIKIASLSLKCKLKQHFNLKRFFLILDKQ